jgi:hypothetical protein
MATGTPILRSIFTTTALFTGLLRKLNGQGLPKAMLFERSRMSLHRRRADESILEARSTRRCDEGEHGVHPPEPARRAELHSRGFIAYLTPILGVPLLGLMVGYCVVATQTGLALEVHELAQSLALEAAQRARSDRELEIAHQVQERLFPQLIPEIPGMDLADACRPAQGVGGDYYDMTAFEDGRLGVDGQPARLAARYDAGWIPRSGDTDAAHERIGV